MNDTIYRKDAIQAVWKPQVKPNELIFDALKTAIESEINNVPSADSLQGEWIDKGDYAECSNCGADSGTQFDGVELVPRKTNFCPNCGAKMKGTEE